MIVNLHSVTGMIKTQEGHQNGCAEMFLPAGDAK